MATLLHRLGGVDRVREIVADFYRRLAADPMVGFFFFGRDLAAIIDGQLAFLTRAMGGEPTRAFRHPKDAHRDLAPILRGHFDRRLTILREVLEQHGLGAAEIEAWLRIERSMRRHVQVGAHPTH